jgi:hypothetical protein
MAEDCLHSGGPIIGQYFAEKSGKRRMRGGGFDPCGIFSGVAFGNFSIKAAARPLTKGAAMEVPLKGT